MEKAVELSNMLGCVKIDNIETIAANTNGRNRDDYVKNFAERIVRSKLDASCLNYSMNGGVNFIEYRSEKFLIIMSPESILEKSGKENVKRHAHKIQRMIDDNSLSGAVYFMPFIMNNGKVRDVLKKELLSHIGFVNLPYDEKGLERRVKEYLL